MGHSFWIGCLQIIWIDILLSGDNAVVIALACRSLPRQQRTLGIVLGTGAAIGLRIALAAPIAYVMAVPLLSMIGALLLFWIAVKLTAAEEDSAGKRCVPTHRALGVWAAIRTIVIADAVMSLDNVIAIAAASHGSIALLAFGLLLSVPLIVFGSTLVLRLIERFPTFVYAGAGLLGWIAGETFIGDPALDEWLAGAAPYTHYLIAALGALAAATIGLSGAWSKPRWHLLPAPDGEANTGSRDARTSEGRAAE